MSECVQKTLVCRGLRVGPSKVLGKVLGGGGGSPSATSSFWRNVQRHASAEWTLCKMFRFSHRFGHEILVNFSLGRPICDPNPGKCRRENFTQISRQISRHLWQRKTEKRFTSALLQGSCSECTVSWTKFCEFFYSCPAQESAYMPKSLAISYPMLRFESLRFQLRFPPTFSTDFPYRSTFPHFARKTR